MSIIKTASGWSDTIKLFLKEFDNGKYIKTIDQLTGSNFLIHFYDVFDYDQSHIDLGLFDCLMNNTDDFIKGSERAIREIYNEKNPGVKFEINISIDTSENEITVDQAIKHKHRNKLVKIQAMVNGETPLITKIIHGVFYCGNGHVTELTGQQNNGTVKPQRCSDVNCKSRYFDLDLEKSDTTTVRKYYLREQDYDSKHIDTLIAEASGDLVNQISMGDNVELIGVIKLCPTKQDGVINNFYILNAKKTEERIYEVTDEDKKIYESWVDQDGFYHKLIDSFAPHIYKARLQKEAFILAYVGSPKWDVNQRYWINVFNVGDPATAKSQIIKYASRVLPNVEFITSKGASAKGLFAGLKEQTDGQRVLEIGQICRQSGKGLVGIDEFARMPEVYDAFYTPMESGVFNSATVGGHAELKAETPIYATGNPHKDNFYDDTKSLIENLHRLTPALLSRFDLIIITKDSATEFDRTNIARTIVGLKNLDGDSKVMQPDIFNENDLVKFLIYAKTFKPELTEEVQKEVVEIFGDIMKKKYLAELNQNDVNNRLIPTLLRLTLTIARLHLHKYTTLSDVSLAHQLLEKIYDQRGLQIGNTQTYIERIGRKVLGVLEETGQGMTDEEIWDALFLKHQDKQEHDNLQNDLGEGGHRRDKNHKWRDIMKYVENSWMVDTIQKKNPRLNRYKKEQTKIA